MSSNREIELKLRLSRDQVGRFASMQLLQGAQPARTRLHTTYFDNSKRDLARRGYELRVRDDGSRLVQTLKRGAGLDRSEWEAEIPDDSPSLDRLGGAAGILRYGDELEPIFSLDVDRSRWSLTRGEATIEVSLDHGELLAGDRRAGIHEAELELKEGPSERLFDLAQDFAKQIDAPISFVSKGERGYRLARGQGKAPESEIAIHLDGDMPVHVAFQQICDACLRQFSINEERLRDGVDGEALHQARVAIRRLRAAFSMFKSVAVGSDADKARAELKWLSDRLGAARDLDVFVAERLKTANLRRPSAPGFDALQKAIAARREEATAELTKALHSERFRVLLITVGRCVQAGEWLQPARDSPAEAGGSFDAFARQECARRLAATTRKRKIVRGDDARKQHRLRIKAKKLRYMIEFSRSTPAGEDFARAGRRLAKLQKRLGAIADSVAATRLLGEVVQERGDYALTYAATLVRQEGEEPRRILVRKAVKAHDELRKTKAPSIRRGAPAARL